MVSWIPADAVAKSIIDVILSEDRLPPTFNLVHPRPVPWSVVVEGINQSMVDAPLPIVPFDEWLAKIEQCEADHVSLDRVVRDRLVSSQG
jgi:NAD dependent epimerase/dehydratase family enzyme